ncbi:hypothetical protein NA57DRAFT_60188 [Rhizodiscina lignyota]|uniref:Glycine-rich domain-containing protein 1 n=1 Tax=Rhizodiscina lignyota TaxID=1504668 RepID=A0A9P4I6G4_9PEZI|nr:hypothetical protein NA57DRAFT_60188 [Rhizodiscina lignyota]
MEDKKIDEKPPFNGADPPAYEGPTNGQPPPDFEDLTARLNNLNLSQSSAVPTPDQCIAHLKFLEALHQLRESVAQTEGLFDLISPPEKKSEKPSEQRENAEAQVRVREKRWAVYVARAVDRFETWWNMCIPSTVAGTPSDRLTAEVYLAEQSPEFRPLKGKPIMQLSQDQLPPLDVLMVWHSYMLNPRCFLEDCIRFTKLDFYATPFPFQHIDQCIDSVTFEYIPTARARSHWEQATSRMWDNLHEPMEKTLLCPNSGNGTPKHFASFPWTSGARIRIMENGEMNGGCGYADADFQGVCETCSVKFTHDYLRVQKFRNDLVAWNTKHYPLPGTILGRQGLPEPATKYTQLPPECWVPNLLISGMTVFDTLEGATKPDNDAATMTDVKGVFEAGVKDRKTIIALGMRAGRLPPSARTAIRRMLNRYWFNSSPFALDLVGAVVRQGSFIDKMHNIDWLRSPALQSTMVRLIEKYQRFFGIMKDNPWKLAVPTLDVDLAWHTHQLTPQMYYTYSVKATSQLIDHDDKIAEADLSDAFEWTSKTYSKMYNEAYSQCNCWYCEAVRESHTSTFSRMTKKSDMRQPDEGCPSDPLKSAHISAHNAVRDTDYTAQARARVKAAELDKAYHKACARARKKGRTPPPRDDYFYAYAYGYPYFFPLYYPYAVDPCIGGAGVYACDPAGVNTGAGSYGACAAGTCGGMAAAGGCGSGGCGGGGCGGGGGGCGGGGGGGCGGGGGGGCGGGGGG